MFNFIKYRKVYYVFSGILIAASIFFLFKYQLNFGIDFNGGSILEAEFGDKRPSNQEIEQKLADLDLGLSSIQPAGDKGVIIRMKAVSEDVHQKVLERLRGEEAVSLEEKSFESIGPVIGQELKAKTKIFAVLVLLAIVFFVAIAFRKASRPVSSWKYGVIASLVAFFHDILIPLGVFSFLGKFYNVPVTIPIVVGLLTILGYSVHDTIVVFDRIRENLFRSRGQSFGEVVNQSLNQTFVRSVNTSLTTLLALLAVFFLGGETLRYFSLVLILGILTGTYSSIFIASPILVDWSRKR